MAIAADGLSLLETLSPTLVQADDKRRVLLAACDESDAMLIVSCHCCHKYSMLSRWHFVEIQVRLYHPET